MLKAIGTLSLQRAVARSLVASAAVTAPALISCTQATGVQHNLNAKRHLNVSRTVLGGGDHEFVVNKKNAQLGQIRFQNMFISSRSILFIYFYQTLKHRDTPENNANTPFDFTQENYAVSFVS